MAILALRARAWPFCRGGQIPVTYYPSFKKFGKGPWGGGRVGVRKSGG